MSDIVHHGKTLQKIDSKSKPFFLVIILPKKNTLMDHKVQIIGIKRLRIGQIQQITFSLKITSWYYIKQIHYVHASQQHS